MSLYIQLIRIALPVAGQEIYVDREWDRLAKRHRYVVSVVVNGMIVRSDAFTFLRDAKLAAKRMHNRYLNCPVM